MSVKYNKIIDKFDYYFFVFPSVIYSPLQHLFLTCVLGVFIFQILNQTATHTVAHLPGPHIL